MVDASLSHHSVRDLDFWPRVLTALLNLLFFCSAHIKRVVDSKGSGDLAWPVTGSQSQLLCGILVMMQRAVQEA